MLAVRVAAIGGVACVLLLPMNVVSAVLKSKVGGTVDRLTTTTETGAKTKDQFKFDALAKG